MFHIFVSTQNIDLVALNLDQDASLDALFGENDAEISDNIFDKALGDLIDIRNAHCSSRLDHAYLLHQVSQ